MKLKGKSIRSIWLVFGGVALIILVCLVPAFAHASVNTEDIFAKMGNSEIRSERFYFAQKGEGELTAKINYDNDIINIYGASTGQNGKDMKLNSWLDGENNKSYGKVSNYAGEYNNKWLSGSFDDDDDDDDSNPVDKIKEMAGSPISYGPEATKKLQATRNFGGYEITYDGKNRDVWNDTMEIYKGINEYELMGFKFKTSDEVTPDHVKVDIKVDNHHQLTYVHQEVSYYTDDRKVTLEFTVDNINKYNNLRVPYSVKEDAISEDDIEDSDDLDY